MDESDLHPLIRVPSLPGFSLSHATTLKAVGCKDETDALTISSVANPELCHRTLKAAG
jgi:hypothetical protein